MRELEKHGKHAAPNRKHKFFRSLLTNTRVLHGPRLTSVLHACKTARVGWTTGGPEMDAAIACGYVNWSERWVVRP